MANFGADYITMPRFFSKSLQQNARQLIPDELWSKSQNIRLACWKRLKIITFQIGSASGDEDTQNDLMIFKWTEHQIHLGIYKASSCQDAFPQIRLSQHQAQSTTHNSHSANTCGRKWFQSRSTYQYHKFYSLFWNIAKTVNNSHWKEPNLAHKKSCKHWSIWFGTGQLARSTPVTKVISIPNSSIIVKEVSEICA